MFYNLNPNIFMNSNLNSISIFLLCESHELFKKFSFQLVNISINNLSLIDNCL